MKRWLIMSDNEIRQILIERKKEERKKMKRRALMLEVADDIGGWICLMAICFMLSGIGA